ncbi:hypothetical protein EDF60_1250 [Leucobacter luti]|nr:hypothetical protein EDF60_1250 [Leucobacter luti]
MNKSSRGWADFLRSFIDAFVRASRKNSGGTGSGSRSGGTAQPRPRQDTKTRPSGKPGSRSGAPATEGAGRGPGATSRGDSAKNAEVSPGQFGPGATRDLTRTEIQRLKPSYAPRADGDPDPGEIVWTWVPYEEHDGRGKDRPVLIIARIDADTTAGCYLSTKAHRGFVSIGTGPWDSQGRESFLSPERVLLVSHAGMRREGTVLSRERFAPAVAAVLREHGISA